MKEEREEREEGKGDHKPEAKVHLIPPTASKLTSNALFMETHLQKPAPSVVDYFQSYFAILVP